MRKVLLVTVLLASAAFSYNTVLGNRGTFGVYSATCEDMGMLTFDLNAYATMLNIDSLVPPDTVAATAQLTEILPYMAVSFTPWHYLEFALWGHGRYATFGAYTSSAQELYNDLGLSVKGGIPIYFNETKRSYFAPGIDGFAYMEGIGTNVFGFGGRGLMTLNLNWFGMHLNGGYEYITTTTASANILGGVGLEVWPFRWGGLIVDGTARIPQNDMGNFANYLRVTPGLRFGFGGRVVKFNINLGVELEPMQTPIRWHGLAGFGLGFDLMPPAGVFVQGIVVDKITQKPVADAAISIEGHSEIETYTTGEDGRFSIETPSGEFYLAAEHPDYIPTRVSSELIQLEGGTIVLEMPPATGGATVLGMVSDARTDEPVSAVIRLVSLTSDAILPAVKSDPVSGYYRTTASAGTYRIEAEAAGYKKTHKSVMLEETDEVVVDFKLEPAAPEPSARPVVLPCIYFGRGETGLSLEDYAPLQDAVAVLKDNPGVRIELQGNTDSVGEAAANYSISVRRAETIRNFLVQNGISYDRIRVVGYGESRPRGDNRTTRGRDMNRRVDIVAF